MDFQRIPICDDWSVEYSPPILRILENEKIVFESNQWNPNHSDPLEDALTWASAVADKYSGLTVEDTDDPDFTAGVRYVRENAPSLFSDECCMMAEDRRNELEKS